ncbi:MAG: dockerin type I repeat-containing protein [Planctomycetota bacterium]
MLARSACAFGIALLCFSTVSLAQPINDDCANPAPLLPGQLGIINATGATPSVNLGGCANFVEDVWFSVTVPSAGVLLVEQGAGTACCSDQHAVYLRPGPAGTCPTDGDILDCAPNNDESLVTVAAGETYLIRVGSWQGGNTLPGNLLIVDLFPFPANDDCDSPEVVPSLPATIAYDANGATATSPSLACTPQMLDLWYEVAATQTGLMAVDGNASGTAFGVDVAAYLRPSPGVCPSDAEELSCEGNSSMSFAVTSGETYLIRVGFPFGGFAAGDLSIQQSSAPPSNDDCTTALSLALPSTTAFDTIGATPDTSGLTCNMNDDLWFRVMPPADGQVRVTIDGVVNDRHQLYQVAAGVCPTNADEVSPCWGISDSYTSVLGGLNYLIRVGQSNTGPVAGDISVEWVPHPANDECTSPQALPIPSFGFNVSTVGATETAGLGCTSHGDTWYSFIAPSTGTLFLNFGDFVHRGLYDYNGISCPATAPIECGGGSFAYWDVVGGNEYLLWISFLNQFPPVDTTLDIQMLTIASNDDCTPGAPTTLTVPTAAPITWDNTGGLDDTQSLGCDIDKDLWYRFTAPFDGSVRFTQSTLRPFAIYHDASLGTACPTNSDQLLCSTFINASFVADFSVQSGESYLIRVGGSSQTPTSGSFELAYVLDDPEITSCDASVPNQVTATYNVPIGSNYDLGVDVSIDGVFTMNIPQTQTSFTQPLAPAFGGVIKIGFTGISSTLGASGESICAQAIGGPAYDVCATALPIVAGDTPFNNAITVLEPNAPLSGCSQNDPDRDVWFSFTATSTELFTAATCTTPWFHSTEVYLANPGCPGPSDVAIDCADQFDCDVSFFATSGQTYYIRVTGLDNGFGDGTLSLVADCSALTGLTADYDCTTGSVTLDWDGGLHVSYDIVSDLGVLAAGHGSATFVDTNAVPGFRSYFVTGSCPNGAALTAQVDVYVADLTNPGVDLILALEGLEDNGNFGNIDSVSALNDALNLGLGRSTTILAFREFDQFACLSTLTDAAEIIWVMGGTAPNNYGLSIAERDLLAGLAAGGTSIYMESASHWSFAAPSLLDLRDGIEPDSPGNNIDSGDDTFTEMLGTASGLTDGDFTSFAAVPYIQDSTFAQENTDQLIVSGTDVTGTYPPDPDITAGPIWVNSDDTLTGEPAYVTGVLAEHNIDGGRMISTSFEFGGYQGSKDALAQAYVTALTGSVVTPMEEFVRGDTNGDNANNIADAVYLLGNLFPVGSANVLQCLESADANNDGSINIADAVAILGSLFGNPAVPLAAPFPNCGTEADSPNQTGIGCVTGTCP